MSGRDDCRHQPDGQCQDVLFHDNSSFPRLNNLHIFRSRSSDETSRDRKIAAGFKCGGRKSYAERSPELVAAAKALQAERPRLSARQISARLAEQGFTNRGRPYAAMSVSGMLRG
jgi:hypothetical protein